MSNLTVRGNPSGTGTVILESPNTNTNRTVTLPDASGTAMLTNTPVTQAQLATPLNAAGSAPIYAARAWVNFDGTTGTIRASGNVASVTRTTTGTYTVTFTTAMDDANYSIVGTALSGTALQYANVKVDSMAAGSFTITTTGQNSGNPALVDFGTVCLTIFR